MRGSFSTSLINERLLHNTRAAQQVATPCGQTASSPAKVRRSKKGSTPCCCTSFLKPADHQLTQQLACLRAVQLQHRMATRRPASEARSTEAEEHTASQDRVLQPQVFYGPSIQLTSMTVVVVFCTIALVAFLAGLTTGPVFWGDPEPVFPHPRPHNRCDSSYIIRHSAGLSPIQWHESCCHVQTGVKMKSSSIW